MSWDGYVHRPGAERKQVERPGGRSVAEHRAGSAGRQLGMANRVHAAMDPVKATRPSAAVDRVVLEAERPKLPPRDHPVLRRSQLRHPGIAASVDADNPSNPLNPLALDGFSVVSAGKSPNVGKLGRLVGFPARHHIMRRAQGRDFAPLTTSPSAVDAGSCELDRPYDSGACAIRVLNGTHQITTLEYRLRSTSLGISYCWSPLLPLSSARSRKSPSSSLVVRPA